MEDTASRCAILEIGGLWSATNTISDAAIVEGDPLRDLEVSRRPNAVWVRGARLV